MAARVKTADRFRSRAVWELRKAHDFLTDVRLGIRTGGKLPDNFAAQLASRHRPNEGTHYAALKIVAQRLELNASDILFDIGCGYGRPLCYFASLGVQRCVGVEIDPTSAGVARRNASKFGSKAIVIAGDALAQDYASATAIYMYNPFSSDVLRPVLERIGQRHSPALRICYVNPVERSAFDDMRWLRMSDQFSVPRRGGRMDAAIWTAIS